MKILWIEDFNEGKSTSLKSIVMDYYQLEENTIEIIETFDDALSAMKSPAFSYDLVLLDIKGIFSGKSDKQYEEYFQNYVSRAFYDEQMDSADTGILLYMYLREVKNYPKDRIAFLSAYLKSQQVGEVVAGQSYYGDEEDEDEALPPSYSSPIQSADTNKIMGAFDKFDASGIFIQHKFFKPPGTPDTATEIKQQEKNCAVFHEKFLQPNMTEYVKFRRNVIEMASILQTTYRSREKNQDDLNRFVRIRKEVYLTDQGHISDTPTRKVQNNLFNQKIPNSGTGRDVYQPDYFNDLLTLSLSLPLDSGEQENEILLGYLKNLLLCADCFTPIGTKGVSHFDLASAFLMKKARNSLSHGNGREDGANSILAMKEYIVPLFFRLIFDVNTLKNKYKETYLTLEQELIGKFNQGDTPDKNRMADLSKALHETLLKEEFKLQSNASSKVDRIELTKEFDTKFKNEKNVPSFGKLFITKNFPASFTLKKPEGHDVYNLWVQYDSSITFSKEELFYLQIAYQIAKIKEEQ